MSRQRKKSIKKLVLSRVFSSFLSCCCKNQAFINNQLCVSSCRPAVIQRASLVQTQPAVSSVSTCTETWKSTCCTTSGGNEPREFYLLTSETRGVTAIAGTETNFLANMSLLNWVDIFYFISTDHTSVSTQSGRKKTSHKWQKDGTNVLKADIFEKELCQNSLLNPGVGLKKQSRFLQFLCGFTHPTLLKFKLPNSKSLCNLIHFVLFNDSIKQMVQTTTPKSCNLEMQSKEQKIKSGFSCVKSQKSKRFDHFKEKNRPTYTI